MATIYVAVFVVPNDNFSLDEQIQDAVGPFSTSEACYAWINKQKTIGKDFYTCLPVNPHAGG